MTRAKQAVPFVTSVRIRNFKSLAEVEVDLCPLTVLVGLNASGKSNFLDALRFVTHALTGGLGQAVTDRGGVSSVWHRPPSNAPSPRELTIDLELQLGVEPATERARYGFTVEAERAEGETRRLLVAREWCEVGTDGAGFIVERGRVVAGPEALRGPAVDPYELLLPASARWPGFMDVYAALRGMSFYLASPPVMRRVEPRTGHATLGPAGERLGEVLGELSRKYPAVKRRIDDYLAATVPGARGIDEYPLPEHSTVRLRMEDSDTGGDRYFGPESISDGTLSVAGLLAALFQPGALEGRIPLVGVEEPELGLHPTAAGALFDALTEASAHVQVIAATQSGDLLDRDDFNLDWARVVEMRDGVTTIGEVDDGSRRVVEQRLATLGELMRSNQLTPRPGPSDVRRPS